MSTIDLDRLPDTIARTKRELRRRLPGCAEVLAEVDEHLGQELEEVRSRIAHGQAVIPELDQVAVVTGRVSEAQVAEIRRRGVVVVRGVFPRAQAEAWNDELADYLVGNGYYDTDADPSLDRYFSALDSARPQIFGIYWSRPQVAARQSEALAATRAFLNGLWKSTSGSTVHFDPSRECTYADRIRRREPGDTTLGLSAHMDAGSVEKWLDPAYRQVYRHVFDGRWRQHDPFDGAFRADVSEIPSPAVCSMFRTYQGWTALTPQGPEDGTLQVVPSTVAIVSMLLRALQDDVPEDRLCGARPGRALSASPKWHGALLEGLIGIPQVEPGDTIWWHPDVLHAVRDRHDGTGYSNVMYIGAAPYCAENAAYLERQRPAFLSGVSPPDFAPEDFEVGYAGRATLSDLTELGRTQMGFTT